MPLSLEVQHLRREHAPLLERRWDVCRERCRGLHRRRARGDERSRARECREGPAPDSRHTHLPRRSSVRNPEQSEQSHHVIDAQRAGMSKAASDEIDEIPIPISPERARIERRKSPVLSVRGVWIRRCADAHAANEQLGERPGVRAGGRATNRQILIESDAHASQPRRSTRRRRAADRSRTAASGENRRASHARGRNGRRRRSPRL